MEKLIVKVTVYKDIEPELFDSINQLPLRQRSAVVRRLWWQGLQAEVQKANAAQPADAFGALPTANRRKPVPGPAGQPAAVPDRHAARARLGDAIAELLSASVQVDP